MPKPSPIRYRTTNWSEYNAALRQRGSLWVWFDPDTVWHGGKTGKRGRPETFSDAAIQTCLTLKVLFGLPLRQTVGLVESLIRMAGLDWPVPDYSTLCRRQARIGVQIPYRCSGHPLNLLIDSTGVKFRGDGEWLARKHGTSRRRQWRKVHIAMDTETGDIRAVAFTSSRQGDSPCCQTCCRKFLRAKRSPLSLRMAHTTHADATPPSLSTAPMPSYRSAGTAAPGKKTAPQHWRETRSCAQLSTSAGHSGKSGPATMSEVGSRPR